MLVNGMFFGFCRLGISFKHIIRLVAFAEFRFQAFSCVAECEELYRSRSGPEHSLTLTGRRKFHSHTYLWHPIQLTRQSSDSPTCSRSLAQAAMNFANQGTETQPEHTTRFGRATSVRIISLALVPVPTSCSALAVETRGAMCCWILQMCSTAAIMAK